MRIGIPDLALFDPERGIGRSALTMVKYWQEWGHEIIPLYPRILNLPALRNLKWGWKGVHGKIDVLFMPNFLGAEGLFFTSKHLPCVVTVNDIGWIECPEDISEATLLTRPLAWLALVATLRAKQVITISDFTQQRLIRRLPGFSSKVQTVYLGVNHSLFYPRNREEARRATQAKNIKISNNDFALIYVGEEYPRKNIKTLIQVFAEVKKDVPQAKLVKVGMAHNPVHRQTTLQYIQQSNLIVGKDILFIENARDADLADLYGSADVFISTSKYEGFGLPLLEAMASGLPSVVSNVGALPEIGGDAVVCIDPENVMGFAAQISLIAQGQGIRSTLTPVLRADSFSWEKAAQETLSVLEAAVH